MTFETVALVDGSVAVRGSGQISPRDDARLVDMLRQARPRADGWIPLLLSSGGRDCNSIISQAMREEHDVDFEMLVQTIDGFEGNEAEVPREDRLIAAPVADCLAIDFLPWIDHKPEETRCGRGGLLDRVPMAARVDVDPSTPTVSEKAPGTVHTVWLLFH